MRRNVLSPYIIVAIFFTALFAPIISANDTTISSNTTWSGNITLEGNVTISQGTTLIVAPGTTIDGGDGFAIEVYGTLNAQSCYFYSSANPTAQSSHGQGLWQGIVIKSGGSATITDVEIENTNVGVKSEGNLDVDNLTVRDSYLGIKNYGTANIEEFYSEYIDYEAIMNSGSLTLSAANISNTSTGIQSTGTLEVTNSSFSHIGAAITVKSGAATVNQIRLHTVSVGLSSVAGVKFSAANITGTDVALLVDMANSDDLTLKSIEASGENFVKSSEASSTRISDAIFTTTATGQTPVIEQSCSGLCVIENVTINDSQRGISLTSDGNHILANSTINAVQYGVRSANEGTTSIENVTVKSQYNGIIIRESDSRFYGTTTIEMTDSRSVGLDILGGTHQIDDLSIIKAYNTADLTSVGAQFWYTEISLQNVTTENYSIGLTMRDAEFEAEFVGNLGGNIIGTEIANSIVSIKSMTTKYQDNGVVIGENSHFSTYQLDAQLHDRPLQIGLGSVAYALDFTAANTNPSYSDASGTGTLYYRANQNLDIACDTSYDFIMTKVKFTDMSDNPVEAIINVNTFEFISNENGEVFLPLISEGSIVVATVLSIGISQSLGGGIEGQIVKIPLIPSGDWVISGDQSITLQSLAGSQTLTGNLVIENNAVLQITDLDLSLAAGKSIVLRDNGQIIAQNSSLIADAIFVNDSSTIVGNDASQNLRIQATVQWNCVGQTNIRNVLFMQPLTLGSGCHLTIENGEANGQLTVPTDSSFTVTSSLFITVLDAGLPVSGAIVQFKGANYYTDTSGELIIHSTARRVDSNGDVSGSNENILLILDNFNELITWDTAKSKTHQFIVSSLDVNDILDSDVTLESRWSPYYLQQDMTIPLGKTFSIMEDVSVRIADGVTITILGAFEANSAVLSSTGLGDRWSGIVMQSQYASLHLDGTTLLEASPTITYGGGELIVNDGLISRSSSSRALIEVNEQAGGSFSLTNMQLIDASGACIDVIESTIPLHISDVEFYACNGPSIRAENAHVAIADIIIGEASSDGFVLSNVNGSIENINAIQFNGAGNIMKLAYINADLLIRNITGTTGGSPAIAGANNRALNIDSINLTGAPGIDFDSSSGTLSNINLVGNGFGTALISHHGRYSNSLSIHSLDISNYAVGIDLHADGPDTTAPLVITDAVISASNSVSAEDYPLILNKAIITGNIEISGAVNVDFIDSDLSDEISIYDGASASLYQSITFTAKYQDITKPTTFDISLLYSDGTSQSIVVEEIEAKLAVKLATNYEQSSTNVILQSLEVVANSVGHPPETRSLTYSEIIQLESAVLFTLRDNQPPQINAISPRQFDIIMQTIPFESSINATDDYDNPSQLSYQWTITDSTGSEVLSASSSDYTKSITIALPGSYLLRVVVTDSFQAQAEKIVPIEVILLDSDGDYLSTCDDTTWFDLAASRSCGPDVYDDDDDNDGIIDSRDEWPLDPCAWQDSDGDRQPDNLNCPDGVLSNLFEDQDDDGDGIPDTLEGSTSDSEDSFDSVTLILIVIGIFVVVLFLRRTRQGLQE